MHMAAIRTICPVQPPGDISAWADNEAIFVLH